MSDRERIRAILAEHCCDLVFILDRFVLTERIVQHAKAFLKTGDVVDRRRLHENLLQLEDDDYTEWN